VLIINQLQKNNSNEYLDGDQVSYCIYIGNYSCIYYVRIWESDGGSGWMSIFGRADDVIFEGVPNSTGIWFNKNIPAGNDARWNAKYRGAENWLYQKGLWNGNIQPGIPAMFLEVSCGCN
jgi:hypothetical protein